VGVWTPLSGANNLINSDLCKKCGILSTRSNAGISRKNSEIWFRELIVCKQTFSQLSNKSGYSERTLKRMFYSYLERYPEWKIVKCERINLLIDGTYFTNHFWHIYH